MSPDFNLMELIGPYRQRCYDSGSRRRGGSKKCRGSSVNCSDWLRYCPGGLNRNLSQMQSGRFDVHLDHRGLEPSVNRLVLGMLVSALFSAHRCCSATNVPPLVRGVSLLGTLGMTSSVVLGLRLMWAIARSGHLDRRD